MRARSYAWVFLAGGALLATGGGSALAEEAGRRAAASFAATGRSVSAASAAGRSRRADSRRFGPADSMNISGNDPAAAAAAGETLVSIYGGGFREPVSVQWLGSDPPLVLETVVVTAAEIVVRMPGLDPAPCAAVGGAFRVTGAGEATARTGGEFTYLGSGPEAYSVAPAMLHPNFMVGDSLEEDELFVRGRGFGDSIRIAVGQGRTRTVLPRSAVTVVDSETVRLTGIAELLAPMSIGLAYDTAGCTDHVTEQTGIKDVLTAAELTVIDDDRGCETVLPAAVAYEPFRDMCRVIAMIAAYSDGEYRSPIPDGGTVSFEDTRQGSCSDEVTVWIRNDGNGLMVSFHAEASGPFDVIRQPKMPLDTYFTTDVGVRFCPTAGPGSTQEGALSLVGAALNSPVTLLLEGRVQP